MLKPLSSQEVYQLYQSARQIRKDFVNGALQGLKHEADSLTVANANMYAHMREAYVKPVTKMGLKRVVNKGNDYLSSAIREKVKPSFDVVTLHQMSRQEAPFYKEHVEVNNLFQGKSRLYFELLRAPSSNTQFQIESYLAQNGYPNVDYVQGYATSENRDRTIKIGKFLRKNDQEKLLHSFENDSIRAFHYKEAHSEQLIVLSRQSYDIHRMSTGRKWDSCARRRQFGECYFKYRNRSGWVIAYLIEKKDPNIFNPLARDFLAVTDDRNTGLNSWKRDSLYTNEQTDIAIREADFRHTL